MIDARSLNLITTYRIHAQSGPVDISDRDRFIAYTETMRNRFNSNGF